MAPKGGKKKPSATRSFSIGLLQILLNAPLYGKVDDRRTLNPAPTEALTGTPTLVLFNSATFLGLLDIKKPVNAVAEWTALSLEENYFSHFLSKEEHIQLCKGFQSLRDDSMSQRGGDGGKLGTWLVKQLAEDKHDAFQNSWSSLIQYITPKINKAVDCHLAENNMSMSQLAQENLEVTSQGGAHQVSEATKVLQKVAAMEAVLGPESLAPTSFGLDIPIWAQSGCAHIYEILFQRWVRNLKTQFTRSTTLMAKVEIEKKGMSIFINNTSQLTLTKPTSCILSLLLKGGWQLDCSGCSLPCWAHEASCKGMQGCSAFSK